MTTYIVKYHTRDMAFLQKIEMIFPINDNGVNDNRFCKLLERWNEIKEINIINFYDENDGIKIYFKK